MRAVICRIAPSSIRNIAALGLLFITWIAPGTLGCEQIDRPDAAYLAQGKRLYEVSCAACHQSTGAGKDGVAPPLTGSSWAQGPAERLVRISLHGIRGPIEVNDRLFNLEMPGLQQVFNDEDFAALLTYIRQAWGNRAAPVDSAAVAGVRRLEAARGDSWTTEELEARE